MDLEKYIKPSKESINFMASVLCRTFNHRDFIRNTFDGFCIQETNYPFICIVIDDASTDGEQEVIKDYLENNFFIEDLNKQPTEETGDYVHYFACHRKNTNCYFAVYLLKYNHYSIHKSSLPYYYQWKKKSKYIALCEGDDFWTDPMKLQKQVSFLDKHPEYSMCFHAYKKIKGNDLSTAVECHNFECDNNNVELTYFLRPSLFVATLSLVYLNDYTEDYPAWAKEAPVGDVPLHLILSSRGKVGYLDDVMGCYRMNSSATSFTSKSQKSIRFFNRYMLGMIRMHKSFDKWSGYKYHDAIKQKTKIEYKKLINRNFTEIKRFLKRILCRK